MTEAECPEPSAELQRLVQAHLRDSLMLRSLIQAEKASLARVERALERVPKELHAMLIGRCLERVAGRFVADP